MLLHTLSRSILGLLLTCLPPLLSAAAPLPTPSGPVLLTVGGDITQTNAGDEAHFDRAMLQALPGRVVETDTPWHREVGRFEGPLAGALLEAVGAQGDVVRVQALDGFEARVPVADFRRYAVILAMSYNGEPMAIRDFGPLFLLYPFSDHAELYTETIRFRSVWQVSHIHVP